MANDLATTEQRGLAVADPEQAAGARRPLPVSLVCQACGHVFVAVLWYRSQGKAYCSDMCRDSARGDRRVSAEARFWAKVNKNGPIPEHRPELGPCWLWTGSSIRGYGSLYSGGRTESGNNLPLYAHRFSYELNVGPIPDGLTIDHLCRVTICVNPTHLEPVTQRVNILGSDGASAQHARATECQRGHPKTPENTYRYPGGTTECRACRRSRNGRSPS